MILALRLLVSNVISRCGVRWSLAPYARDHRTRVWLGQLRTPLIDEYPMYFPEL